MNKRIAASSINKKEYIREIGEILVRDHGKKKYYEPEEVKKASENSTFADVTYLDLDNSITDLAVEIGLESLAMSFYSSHDSFDAYHLEVGDAADYVGLKTEVLSEISDSSILDWISLPDFDIDASWLDMGDLFDGVISGIGEFVVGIFEFF